MQCDIGQIFFFKNLPPKDLGRRGLFHSHASHMRKTTWPIQSQVFLRKRQQRLPLLGERAFSLAHSQPCEELSCQSNRRYFSKSGNSAPLSWGLPAFRSGTG